MSLGAGVFCFCGSARLSRAAAGAVLAEAGSFIGSLSYEQLLAEGDADAPWTPPQDEWDALSLCYTSGTTADPKGVLLHHRGAYLNALNNVVTWGIPWGRPSASEPPAVRAQSSCNKVTATLQFHAIFQNFIEFTPRPASQSRLSKWGLLGLVGRIFGPPGPPYRIALLGRRLPKACPSTPCTSGRCPCSTATAGTFTTRSRPSRGCTSACGRSSPMRSLGPSSSTG